MGTATSMVAISGTFRRKSQNAVVATDLIGAARTIGLDHSEQWSGQSAHKAHDDSIWLATHERLKQNRNAFAPSPYFSENHQLAVVADVRLDDRENLLTSLGGSTDSDNIPPDHELLLSTYAKWGTDCPKYLIGDYAFVIWDHVSKTMFCARDHIGAKPFFYGFPDGDFVFSSDINMVLAAFAETPAFNEPHIAKKLVNWHYSTMVDTAYQGVMKLAPGHSLTLTADDYQLQQYWDPQNLAPLELSGDDEYADALLELLKKAVVDRLRTGDDKGEPDTKFGTHVSGGLDSSAIAAIANDYFRARNKPIPAAFSWQPPPDPNEPLSPEHSWIEAMVEDQGLDMQYVPPDTDDIYKMLLRDGTREPVGGTLLNEEAVQKRAAAQDIEILLSGWGGDEFVSHNGRAYFPELLRTGRWGKLLSELRTLDGNLFKLILTTAVLPAYSVLLMEMWHSRRRRKRNKKAKKDKKTFINADFQKQMKAPARKLTRFMGTRHTQLDLLANGHVTERIELWAANARPLGIEYRYPMLDRRVMEFAFSIPIDQFKRGQWKRWVFRNATRDILPDTVLWNLSKLEQIRTSAMSEPIADAFGRIGDELRSGKLKTTRQKYIDMPRLIDKLDSQKYREDGNLGPTRSAVEFLDFQ